MKRIVRIGVGAALLVLALLPLVAFSATSMGRVLGFFAEPLNGLWAQGVAAKRITGVLELKGLKNPVKIVWDENGVPHVFAENEHDLFQAFGFIQACDRLWQMDLQRRIVYGRLSEILGSAALDTDKWMRMLGLGEAAIESWETIKGLADSGDEAAAKTLEAIEAFTQGVNQCINYMKSTDYIPLEYKLLGVEPEPWRPEDSIAVAKLVDYFLSFTDSDAIWGLLASKLGAKILALYYDYARWVHENKREIINEPSEMYLNESLGGFKPAQPTALPSQITVLNTIVDLEKLGDQMQCYIRAKRMAEKPIEWLREALALGFSNNWIVGRKLSSSKAPLLANDPHLSLTVPPVWYEAHLVARKSGLNVYGVTFPGIPFIVIGRNQYIAFGYTNSMIDVVDFYYYVWKNGKYYYRGEWRQPEKRVEEIIVKKGGGVEKVEIPIASTVHGRLVEVDLGNTSCRLAVKATTLMPEPIAVWVYLVNHARSVYDYLEAQQYFYSPIQNAVVADREHILYSPSGLIPIRTNIPRVDLGDGRSILNTGFLPFNGSRGEGEWIGFLPFTKIPRLLDPREGFVATANNMIVYNYTVDGYPLYLQWSFLDSYRWMRIRDMLASRPIGSLDVEYMKRIQMDIKSEAMHQLIPLLISLAEKAHLGDREKKVVEMLKNWDYSMSDKMVEPTIAYTWLYELLKIVWRTASEKSGIRLGYHELLHVLRLEIVEYMLKTRKGTHYLEELTGLKPEKLAQESLKEALKELEKYYRSKDPAAWTWGRAHKVYPTHILGGVLKWLNYKPLPEPGGPFTVNVAPMIGLGDPVSHGPSVRFIASLAPRETGIIVIPGGNSGHPFSPYYDNQYVEWLKGIYHEINMAGSPSSIRGELLILRP